MDELAKIKEVALKYNISTRALRYYEDVGLIQSIRTDDYAYRLYDDKAIKRIEQILVLRKLDISVKDIQRIFSTNSMDVLLEVMAEKANKIDDEMTLLYELKEIILALIKRLESRESKTNTDLSLLNEKAIIIKARLAKSNNEEINESIGKMMEVTEKLDKMPDIRIIKLPKVKMACAKGKYLLDECLDNFNKWWSSVEVKQALFPRDFLQYNLKLEYFEWLFAIPEGMTDTNGYEVVDFPGGLYAVATAFEDDAETERVCNLIHKWVDESDEFEVSNSDNDTNERYDMGHIVFSEGVYRPQMDIFVPIVIKE
jgi:DNA-binding transcriptional MerR regulator